MALYRINRGPRFGERVHLPASQEVALAVMLGDIEPVAEVQPTTPAEPKQKFTVGYRESYSPRRQGDRVPLDKLLVLQIDMGHGGRMWFDGPPDQAKAHFEAMGHPCPEELLQQYRELYGTPYKPLVQFKK